MDCASCASVVVAAMPASYDAAVSALAQNQTDLHVSLWALGALVLFAMGFIGGRLR